MLRDQARRACVAGTDGVTAPISGMLALRTVARARADGVMLRLLSLLPPAAISSVPWLGFLAVGTIGRLKWKTKTMRFVFRFLENRAEAEFGRLLFAAALMKLRKGGDADDSFARVSDAALVRYALPEAVEVLAGSDPERAKTLLRDGGEAWSRASSTRRLSLAASSAYFGFEDGVHRFTAGLCNPEADILKRLFAEQKRAARKLGVSADYLSVREASLRASGATHGIGGDGEGEKQTGPIRIGLFDYRGPAGSSENLGDFIQTIAVIGQLSRFTFNALKVPEAVRDLLAQGRRREGEAAQSVDGAVELVPVNRDFPVTVAADGSIWLPVCGRFGVRAYPDRFDFPFPGNVRPLFMAFHIADLEFLNEESLAYLRRFEPIGCRDLFTARLLRGAGVAAFFNGCVAMTLDRLRPAHVGRCKGKYDTSRKFGGFGGFTPSPHDDPDCSARDFGGNLRAGLAFLDKYRAAEEVRTDRLNAWLPCRAMGTSVAPKFDRTDPRLDGLLDLDDEAFRDVAAQFEAVAQPILAAVLEGKGEAEVYALWREATAPAMARTDDMIAERNAKYPIAEVSLTGLGLDRIPVQNFGAKRDAGDNEIHLLFAFDANLAEHFPGTFEGVWRHATHPLTVHVFGRGLTAAMFERWAAQFERTRFIHRDLSGFRYLGKPNAVSMNWRHITVSTMDRLLAPELLADVEKVVFLDVDLLVRKDIAELFDIDTGDAPLAACNDRLSPIFHYGHYRDFSVPKEKMEAFRNIFFSGGATVFEEFNAGVLVMNLANLRNDRAVEKVFAIVQTCFFRSQMVLNLYARTRWKPLAPEWNHIPFREVADDPAIVHFIERSKPWLKNVNLPFSAEWRANAARARRRA